MLSKVTLFLWFDKDSGKDGNLSVQGQENTADNEGPPVRAFGVRLLRLVQHEAWRCRQEVWFGLVNEVFFSRIASFASCKAPC